jgi:lysophospholipase L1-like esterase
LKIRLNEKIKGGLILKHILCYGDSNTYGFDGRLIPKTGERRRYDETVRWTWLLKKILGQDYDVIEEGMNGRTTVFDDPTEGGRNGFKSLEVIFQSHQPLDLVVIMLGTNDLKDQFSAAPLVISKGMERLVILLKEMIAGSFNPDAKILIVAPPDVSCSANGVFYYDFSERSVEKGKRLPNFYRQIAERYNCLFADAGTWVKMDSSDGTHLNPDGHSVFARKLAEEIRKAGI